MARLVSALDDPLGEAMHLERPLHHYELSMVYAAGDPTLQVLQQTGWLAPAGLVILVGLVLIGTMITLSSATREIRLSRLQTDFVSSVSHELRTPLTSIRMFVETLQSGRLRDPERVAECLDLLAVETDRLSRMIERVLGWARMEAGRRIYEFEDVDAERLVDLAVAALRSQHLQQEVDIEVSIPEGLSSLRVDVDAIVEALLNLLQNAVRYAPGPIHVTAETGKKGLVGISVADGGPGIDKADRRRIFEKFYQADMRLSAPDQSLSRGTGLGLSIVRAVVRGHGGRVDLWTELGQGSRFTLWLPIAEVSRRPDAISP